MNPALLKKFLAKLEENQRSRPFVESFQRAQKCVAMKREEAEGKPKRNLKDTWRVLISEFYDLGEPAYLGYLHRAW